MSDSNKTEKAIPTSRASRFGRMARLTAGVATGVLAEGVRQISKGNRPAISDMLLTPSNARRVAKQLSTMRGAAMKVGQLLSMETNDLLPKELALILAQLRDSAFTMPRKQLEKCLVDSYGPQWHQQFAEFDFKPLAAASIGQVHRATTLQGDEIVLKIQYPGISESIDSDVDNIASLFRITNILPEHLDISVLLKDAKAQLHDEANYLLEASYIEQFYKVFRAWDNVIVPKPYPEHTTQSILAMQYTPGSPIEQLEHELPSKADAAMTRLFDIMLAEFFEINLMQTDANFANFRYQSDSQNIVLLDFGAARSFGAEFIGNYTELLRAAVAQDDQGMIVAADKLGYKASHASSEYQSLLLAVFGVIFEPFTHHGEYNFAVGGISQRLSELGDQAYQFKKYWQTPPTDILYLHRKLAGLYLLAARLEAKVDCHALLSSRLDLIDQRA